MPNGAPGDSPYTDIVVHKRAVFSAKADDLVREIDKILNKLLDVNAERDLWNLLIKYCVHKPNIAELEVILTERKQKLVADAKRRGIEIDPN